MDLLLGLSLSLLVDFYFYEDNKVKNMMIDLENMAAINIGLGVAYDELNIFDTDSGLIIKLGNANLTIKNALNCELISQEVNVQTISCTEGLITLQLVTSE